MRTRLRRMKVQYCWHRKLTPNTAGFACPLGAHLHVEGPWWTRREVFLSVQSASPGMALVWLDLGARIRVERIAAVAERTFPFCTEVHGSMFAQSASPSMVASVMDV